MDSREVLDRAVPHLGVSQIPGLDIVSPCHDWPRLQGIFDQAGNVLRRIDYPAGVFIYLFEINRRMRPQAEPARATAVVDDSLVFVERRKCGANILLLRLVVATQGAKNRFLCGKEIAII